MDRVGGALVAIAGSTFTAVNTRTRKFTDAKLTKALRPSDETRTAELQARDTAASESPTRPELPAAAVQERSGQFRARTQPYQDLQQRLAASGAGQIARTDPASRALPVAQGVDGGYTVAVVGASTHTLSLPHAVTPDVTAHDQRAALAQAATEVLGVAEVDAVADNGFAHGAQVKQGDHAASPTYSAKPHTARNQHKGVFPNDDVRYAKERDRYGCLQGADLTVRFETEENGRAPR